MKSTFSDAEKREAKARKARVEREHAERNGEMWDDPLPLSAVPAPQAFPLKTLPDCVGHFVDAVAAALHCPADYVAIPVLTIAGASIGASRALEIKPGWTERPGIYAAIVAPPSSAKSPAIRAVAKPVYEAQAHLHEVYRRELKAHEDGADGAAKPRERVLCVSNCTTEKLADILRDTPRGVVMIRDELTAWVGGMNQYKAGGKGDDRQFYLSAWAGEPVIVHRKNQPSGSVFVPHPFVSVLGGLPPDLLGRMRGERDIADGFFDRILFAYPEPPRAVGEDWRCVEEECANQWSNVLASLRALEMEDGDSGKRPRFVRLTSCGRKAWERYTHRLANEMNADGFPDCLRGPWGKFRGYGARLALIVHCLRRAAGESIAEDVDGESVRQADLLVTYFQSHARKVYATIDADPKVADARRVLEWLSVNSVNSVNGSKGVSKRDIHAYVLGSRRTVEEAETVVSILLRHGFLRPVPPQQKDGPGRSPSPRYHVHPSVFLSRGGSHCSQNSQNRDPGEDG